MTELDPGRRNAAESLKTLTTRESARMFVRDDASRQIASLTLDLNQTLHAARMHVGSSSLPLRSAGDNAVLITRRAGSYHYNCPMDRRIFAATGLEPRRCVTYF